MSFFSNGGEHPSGNGGFSLLKQPLKTVEELEELEKTLSESDATMRQLVNTSFKNLLINIYLYNSFTLVGLKFRNFGRRSFERKSPNNFQKSIF